MQRAAYPWQWERSSFLLRGIIYFAEFSFLIRLALNAIEAIMHTTTYTNIVFLLFLLIVFSFFTVIPAPYSVL